MPNNKKYEAVIFDVDGTLLDTIDGLLYSVNYSLQNFGYEGKDPLFIKRNTGHGIRHLIRQSLPENIDDETFSKAVKIFVEHYERTCNAGSEPFPGVFDLLDDLQKNGIKMAQASNKIQDAVQRLNDHFFFKYNILCLGETDTQRRKPAPDMLNIAIEKMHVSKNKVLMVGDSLCDYEAARNAEIDCALVTWGFHTKEMLEEATPSIFVDNTEQLRYYILNTI